MNESTVIVRLMGDIKDTMVEVAEATMLQPFDANRMAVATGKYQGLKMSLDILDNILRDANQKEKSNL